MLPKPNVRQVKEELNQHLAAALIMLSSATQQQIKSVAEQLILFTDGPGRDVLEGVQEDFFNPVEQKEFNHLSSEYEQALW